VKGSRLQHVVELHLFEAEALLVVLVHELELGTVGVCIGGLVEFSL